MTDAAPRRAAPPAARATAASVVLGAVGSAVWAAGIGLAVIAVVVLFAWASDPASHASIGTAVRTAGQAWLLAHHVGLAVPGGRLTLVPLGLAALPILLLYRAGRGLARDTGNAGLRAAGLAATSLGVSYGVVGGVVAGLARTSAVSAAPIEAVLAPALVAAVAGGTGVAAHGGRLRVARGRLPGVLRVTARATAAALLIVGAVAAALVVGALGWRASAVIEVSEAVTNGWGAAVALLLLQVAMLPNAVVWAASVAAGPGFAVGTGTAVSVFAVKVGAVPALPMLAALPGTGGAPVALPVLLVPALAGFVAGRMIAGRLSGRPVAAPLAAAAAGILAGMSLAVLCWLSGGAGPGRLTTFGPPPWRVGLAAGTQIAAVAAATAWWLRPNRRSRAS